MQRTVPNTFANGRTQQPPQQPPTAAMSLAQRIRNEQGRERAKQFLMAMEPFLAPMERQHIAEQIGVELPKSQAANYSNAHSAPRAGGPDMGGMGGMGNPMQLMQMLSSFSQKPQQGAAGPGGMGGMDPMMMAQLLGGLMGKK